MTVSAQTPYNSYTYAGGTTFVYAFQILQATDLQVSVAGVVQPSSNYTVSGVGAPAGGSITYTGALTIGQLVELQRITQLVRTTDYQDEGDYLAKTVNADYDRLWMALQEQQRGLAQVIRVPETTGVPVLPVAAIRANTFLGFDLNGALVTIAAAIGSAAALALQYAGSTGSSFIGFIASFAHSVARLVQDKLRESVSIKDFGSGTEVGALINQAVADGATNILIPAATNWTWTTVVTLPVGWRGRIFSENGRAVTASAISAATGRNNPCIDAQGALFVDVDGLHVLANDAGSAAPACFMVMARPTNGASSGNHRLRRNVIEGPFYYCGVYNVGAEELVLENNYIALYGTAQAVSPKIACVVHQLSEDAFYSAIVTKQARTNGTSTSAIQHRGNELKNQNSAGCSMVYLGPNVNDINFDDVYGTSPASSYCIYAGGYVDGIRVGFERIETDKTTPIFSAPVDVTMGLVSFYKGAYRRSGNQDSTHYAIDIGGTTASSCSVHVAPNVSWTSSFGGGTEDIYLLRSTRLTAIHADFTCGGPSSLLTNTKVNIATWVTGRIAMGFSANLTVGATSYGTESFFLYDPISSKQAHVFGGGAIVKGRPFSVNGIVGAYQAMDSTIDTTGSGTHIYFLNNGSTTPTIVGSISTSGSTTTYATTSDKDAKLDDGMLESPAAIAAVMSWGIHKYRWKLDNKPDVGPFAQELRLVKPSAVVGEEGAVHVLPDGTEVAIPLAVDKSQLIPELVVAVQAILQHLGLDKATP